MLMKNSSSPPPASSAYGRYGPLPLSPEERDVRLNPAPVEEGRVRADEREREAGLYGFGADLAAQVALEEVFPAVGWV
jgi:hypothetical protein